jgi:hypothetical protein
MNEQDLLRKSQEILNNARQLPAKERLRRLVEKGVVDSQGNVMLGEPSCWNAALAVVAVKHNGRQIEHFRCLKPAFGIAGAAQIDVRRESLVHYIETEKKRVITAFVDQHQNRWKEGPEVHLLQVDSQKYLRTDPDQVPEDNLGELPEIACVKSGL